VLIGGDIKNGEAPPLIDPSIQCKAFEAAASRGLIPWLDGWRIDRREIVVGDSRLDYSLKGSRGDQGFLEVKSAFHFTGYYAMYSDGRSTRGRRHILLLHRMKQQGYRCILMFVAAHPEARAFKPDSKSDQELSLSLALAASDGVEVYAVAMSIRADGEIRLLDSRLPVHLD
jgi:sugar fermentation stimulation protein A